MSTLFNSLHCKWPILSTWVFSGYSKQTWDNHCLRNTNLHLLFLDSSLCFLPHSPFSSGFQKALVTLCFQQSRSLGQTLPIGPVGEQLVFNRDSFPSSRAQNMDVPKSTKKKNDCRLLVFFHSVFQSQHSTWSERAECFTRPSRTAFLLSCNTVCSAACSSGRSLAQRSVGRPATTRLVVPCNCSGLRSSTMPTPFLRSQPTLSAGWSDDDYLVVSVFLSLFFSFWILTYSPDVFLSC